MKSRHDGSPGLILRTNSTSALTRAQHTFNRLVTRIEKVRAELDAEIQRLNEAVIYHGQHLQPRRQLLTALRKDLVRLLQPFLDPSRLIQSAERKALRTTLSGELDAIVQHDGALFDDDLRTLYEEFHGIDFERAREAELEEIRSAMEEMFNEIGIEVDLSGLEADKPDSPTDGSTAPEATGRPADETSATRTRRQIEKENQAQLDEELGKRRISSIYKQLARVIHPDLEQDPARKQLKSALMQELTAAYRNNDMHTLLRLELEWMHREENDLERLTNENLHTYNQALKEQVDDMELDLVELPYQPRYQAVLNQDGRDGPQQLKWLDYEIAEMETRIARMKSADDLGEVLRMI